MGGTTGSRGRSVPVSLAASAAILLFAGFLVGALVRRWWIVLLPLVIPIALVPAGEDQDGAPLWALALTYTVPLLIVGLALGVAAVRKVAAR